jgi:hypothetical protein
MKHIQSKAKEPNNDKTKIAEQKVDRCRGKQYSILGQILGIKYSMGG